MPPPLYYDISCYSITDKNSARLIPGSPRRSAAIIEKTLRDIVYPKSGHKKLRKTKNASGIIFFAKYTIIFLNGFKRIKEIKKIGTSANSGLFFKKLNISVILRIKYNLFSVLMNK